MAVFQAKRAGVTNFSHPRLARAGAACDGSHPRVARVPGAGVPGGRARLRGDGLLRVPADCRALPRADRRDRLRAARPAAGDLPLPSSSSRRAARGSRTSTRASCPRRATGRPRRWWPRFSRSCRANGAASGRFRGAAWAARRVSRLRRRAAVRRERDRRRPEPAECIAGLVLQGLKKPHECPAFGTRCTPEHPLGATMVSSEGACAAYYRHRRFAAGEEGSR